MSSFRWRDTLQAIQPPFFTRLGCSFVVIVLVLHFAALLIGGLFLAVNFYSSGETTDKLSNAVGLIIFYSPIVALMAGVFAFFESVDFLIWLKLPLYPPKPAPPSDPLKTFQPPEN